MGEVRAEGPELLIASVLLGCIASAVVLGTGCRWKSLTYLTLHRGEIPLAEVSAWRRKGLGHDPLWPLAGMAQMAGDSLSLAIPEEHIQLSGRLWGQAPALDRMRPPSSSRTPQPHHGKGTVLPYSPSQLLLPPYPPVPPRSR